MPKFAIRYPYLISVICVIVCVLGISTLTRMPVDLFPPINIPVVVVATFYSGMPPEEIESAITAHYERFFTLASGIDHMESRSLPGVSLIKIYFQPGSNPDAAVSTIGNLAAADLRHLPPGTWPPVVLRFDASSLPVCLVTLKGQGLDEAQLHDYGQFAVRNQVANVPGASVPSPFGGRYRQIMVYVDPIKLEAHQLSVMDVVRAVNDSNLILPAGNVKVGPFDYNLYVNSELHGVDEINSLPLKTVGNAAVLVGDVGVAKDASGLQYCIVRVDGQKSVYLPVLKQGGDANTISVVNGVKNSLSHLVGVPKELITKVVFDQSIFVKNAIENLLHEGAIGLLLTGIMILVFLGNSKATLAVFLSIPLSTLATFIVLGHQNGTINSMTLGGLALVFSRLIDNSVVVLENIFRHLELGESPEVAAEKGGAEVALPVLAATLTTAVVFFPVTFLYGVSQFLFTALALSVVFALAASYFVALTVVPLFCANFIKSPYVAEESGKCKSWGRRFNDGFNSKFKAFVRRYGALLEKTLNRPRTTVLALTGVFLASLLLCHFVGVSYFPRTDPGQFVINLKATTGTRLENTEALVQQVEKIIREEVAPEDLDLVVANIGVQPGLAAMYTSNSGEHTAFVQASLKERHRIGSYEYMDRVRRRIRRELPQVSAYVQGGGLLDAILNLGLPAPIDIQVTGNDLNADHQTAVEIARQLHSIKGVSDVLVPQDVDFPSIQLDIDRRRAGELGLNAKEVVSSVITALNSDEMIAPSFWIDPRNGNDYFLTVQYPEEEVKDLEQLRSIPLRASGQLHSTRLDSVSQMTRSLSSTEVDHYQLQREMDVYVSTKGEDLGDVMKSVNQIIHQTHLPEGMQVNVRGMVQGMNTSFRSFGLGLILAVLLVYLILVAQFKSLIDPFLILLAVPSGLTGVLVTLLLTGTTLNVMSLMGIVMMVGIVVSNSILIVEFTHRLREDGKPLREAVVTACQVRLRPVLMTSLATLIGLIPMAAKLGTGAEAYAPLARAIIGGLTVSVVLTMFIVPAAYLLVYRNRPDKVQIPIQETLQGASA
jgi:multidrug efflux pump subunit AcrB